MTTYNASCTRLAEGNDVKSTGTGRDERAGEGEAGGMYEDDTDNGVVMKERVCYAMYCNNTVLYD
jgi:hypothetical protein